MQYFFFSCHIYRDLTCLVEFRHRLRGNVDEILWSSFSLFSAKASIFCNGNSFPKKIFSSSWREWRVTNTCRYVCSCTRWASFFVARTETFPPLLFLVLNMSVKPYIPFGNLPTPRAPVLYSGVKWSHQTSLHVCMQRLSTSSLLGRCTSSPNLLRRPPPRRRISSPRVLI